MPATYERQGISFQYPDNWTLEEEPIGEGQNMVTVSSPGTAFWTVTLHAGPADLQEFARTAVEAMRTEYEQLETEAAEEELDGHEVVGYDLNFQYLDLINTAQVRCVQVGQVLCCIFCQAENREFDRLEAVFQAITVSLLRGLEESVRPW